jgi:hypothetical protein
MMGGYLSRPAKAYPTVFSQDGFFGQFPYFLVNSIAAGVLLIGFILTYLYLTENPSSQKDKSPGHTPLAPHDALSNGDHVDAEMKEVAGHPEHHDPIYEHHDEEQQLDGIGMLPFSFLSLSLRLTFLSIRWVA